MQLGKLPEVTTPQMDFVKPIVDAVCRTFNVTVADLDKRQGSPQIVLARHVAWAIIRERTKMSLERIGLLFGKDHATVRYGIIRLQDVFDTDPLEKKRFEAVRAQFFLPKGTL